MNFTNSFLGPKTMRGARRAVRGYRASGSWRGFWPAGVRGAEARNFVWANRPLENVTLCVTFGDDYPL